MQGSSYCSTNFTLMRKFTLILCILFGHFVNAHAQATADSVLFTELSFYEFSDSQFSYHSRFHPIDENYVYSASANWGLRVFDISQPSAPQLIQTFSRSTFNGLQPDNLEVDGNLLYVCLGALQSTSVSSGLAIFDVSSPSQPVFISQWDSTAFTDGIAAIHVEDGYAYLGGMEDGLHILDVSTPNDIRFVSNIVPDINWQPLPNLDPNARGMKFRNDTVFLAYDSGGLRLIDVSDKRQPLEVYKYINDNVNSTAVPIYNNVLIHGTKAYISLDYCGFEVVDFGTPDTILPISWINPFGCLLANWFGNNGHSNELAWLDPGRTFLSSAGKTDLVAVDASDPNQPSIIGQFGVVEDSTVAWGVALNSAGDKAVLSYIESPIAIPFIANRGGIAVVEVDQISTALPPPNLNSMGIDVYPKPIEDSFSMRSKEPIRDLAIRVYDLSGKQVFSGQKGRLDHSGFEIDSRDWKPGIYLLEMLCEDGIAHQKLIKTN